MAILTINSGSSTLKAKLFSEKFSPLFEIIIEDHKTIPQAIKRLFKQLDKKELTKEIKIIAQRVVHGGEKYSKPTKITPTVLSEIKKLSSLAPLHNPINAQSIEAVAKILPKIPQIAVFDTAFHTTMPEKAFLYAIPSEYYEENHFRRYGFHGTSHKFVISETLKLLKKKQARIISCHLGNGSSITASKNGSCIDTSMGLSPLEGIPMGTRSGSIDPAIILELARKIGVEPTNIMLNKKSGLLALSGISSDMREIFAASLKKDPKALLTIEILAYQIAKYCGAYCAALGGLDALVFTGGLGEKAYYVREKVCEYFKFLDLKLDKKANKNHQVQISAKDSAIKTLVIPTDEALQMAREVRN